MAVDLFLKIEGIKGECQKDGHKDEIDIESFSYAISQEGDFQRGGAGGTSGKADIHDISVMKQVDKSSPDLFKFCASGKHISTVEIYSQKSGDGDKPLTYYTIKLEDVIVSNVSNSGSAGGNAIMETVSFNTAKFTFKYQAQKADGGKDGGEVPASYDARKNVVT
ncbi:MAG: type VI secretion system tube protein Hcp [Pseudomonadota bacterium]